jgi:glycosyltransferase involved in cell wall biosynthesis
MKTGRIFLTGRYREAEVPHLLRRESPHVVFLPSVWPETWCYTLSHSLASGLPVAAFDIGAIAERLRAEQKGMLFRPGVSPGEINDRLIELGRAGHE